MRTVTKEAFYRIMGPLNVHPRSERDRSEWIDQRTGDVLGISKPGYTCEGPESYEIKESLLPEGDSDV